MALSSSGKNGTQTSSTTVPFHAGISVGDLLILVFSKDGSGSVTTPDGWTLLKAVPGSSYNTLSIFYRFMESGLTSVAVTHAYAYTTWVLISITDAVTIEASTGVYGSSYYPDPDSLTPGFPAGTNNLWIAVAGWDYERTVTAWPTGWNNNRETQAWGCGVATAIKESTNATENPPSFTLNYTDQWLACTIAVKYRLPYKTSGTYTVAPIDVLTLATETRLHFSCETPTNTSITAEYAISSSDTVAPTTWTTIAESGVISLGSYGSGDFLWIKFTLATTDTTVTPSISAIWLEEANADPNKIKINLAYDGRIRYPQGDVSIAFTGSMSGIGGSMVAPFTESFTPTDIVPFFMPNDAEYITASADMSISCFDVVYSSAQSGDEYLTAKVTGMTIVVTKVGSLPL